MDLVLGRFFVAIFQRRDRSTIYYFSNSKYGHSMNINVLGQLFSKNCFGPISVCN
jgi:hypothetical protein